MTRQQLIYWLGLPGLAVGAVVATTAVLDYLGVRPVLSREIVPLVEEIAANTSAVQLIRWQLLEQRRINQGLSPTERVEFCALSRRLGLRGEGCA